MKTRYPIDENDIAVVHAVDVGVPVAISRPEGDEHTYFLFPNLGVAVSFWKEGAVLYLSKETKAAIAAMGPEHTRLVSQFGKMPTDKIDSDVYDKLVQLSRGVHSTKELLNAD